MQLTLMAAQCSHSEDFTNMDEDEVILWKLAAYCNITYSFLGVVDQLR